MLTGYNIELFRDIDEVAEEDTDLAEFRDEIDGWVIDQLKKIGCSTAKNVLATSRERLIREADLEEDTVDEVLAILRFEFEEEETEEEVGSDSENSSEISIEEIDADLNSDEEDTESEQAEKSDEEV